MNLVDTRLSDAIFALEALEWLEARSQRGSHRSSCSRRRSRRRPPRSEVPRPDLKITSLVANFGDPAYAIVGTDGVMEPIQVRVGIRNQGRVVAPASVLDVFYQDSARQHHQLKINVPKLKFSIHSRFFTVDMVGTRPKLGHAQLGAVANFTNKFKETDTDNNFFKGEHFEVIARQWNVPYFDTILSIPGAGARTTSSQSSFHFEFSSYDHSKAVYVYLPTGSISSTMLYAGGFCSGSGSLTDSKAPWGGFLHIAGDFRYYDASVDTSSITYTVPLTCVGGFSSTVRGVRRSGHDRERDLPGDE